MSKLTEIFYLAGNDDTTSYDKNKLKIESVRAAELHDKFYDTLNDEQKNMFEELSEIESHIQSIQEGIIAAKGTALGIQIASEAFLINTGGDDYDLFRK